MTIHIYNTKGYKPDFKGLKQISVKKEFSKPTDYKKVNWKKKYTPSWALKTPITGIIYEDTQRVPMWE